MKELLKYLDDFSNERDWDQFHCPANLAKSVVIEANELLEHFQFDPDNYNKDKVLEELADVMVYCLDLCLKLDVDPIEIIYKKMKQNEAKYPVEKCKGTSKKYTEL